MNKFYSVSDKRYLDKLIGTSNKNRSLEVYKSGKHRRDQEIDLAYELCESELIEDLSNAEDRADVYDLLYSNLESIINHYGMNIEPEDVLPDFWKVYKLKDK